MGEAFITRRGGGAKFAPASQLFSASGTYSVPYTGTYRITAIGKGADGVSSNGYESVSCTSGGAGGGGVLEVSLNKGDSLTVSVSTSASSVKKGSTTLINATAGSGKKAGSVSGTGVVAFASNGKETTSITPPSCYNSPLYISQGGQSGWGCYFDSTESDDEYLRNATPGGNGLFGGDGGTGGDGFSMYVGSYQKVATLEPDTVNNGAGAGGIGAAQIRFNGLMITTMRFGGGGGGGGYGGGGGAGTGKYYYYGRDFYIKSNGGTGGAGCVFIERIA